MLTYEMSPDGTIACMGPCTYPGIRLAIIRLCGKQSWNIPDEVLNDDTPLETLQRYHFGLIERRNALYRAEARGRADKRRLETAVREGRLSPETAAQVAALRSSASNLRQAAQRAERMESARGELARSAELEAEANRLIKNG